MKRAVTVIFLLFCLIATAQGQESGIRVGFIGSLSGFSARYGSAVLDGARLAEAELKARGQKVEFFVEDDQSNPSQVTSAWQKLSAINRVKGLIGGTWWANSIAPLTSRAAVPFLSCETLYNKEWIVTDGYFTLLGDLRDWIRAYEPLIESRGWKTGAMVKFTSGFADTLEEELQRIFSTGQRHWLKSIEYSEIDLKEAATIAAQLRALKPEVVYIDAQPQGFATLMKRISEQKITGITIISNTIVKDAVEQKLFDPASFQGEILYSSRETFASDFAGRFKAHFGREPILNADLGYYAFHLMVQALSGKGSPVSVLKAGESTIDGRNFPFDEKNVYHGVQQRVFTPNDTKR